MRECLRPEWGYGDWVFFNTLNTKVAQSTPQAKHNTTATTNPSPSSTSHQSRAVAQHTGGAHTYTRALEDAPCQGLGGLRG